MATKPSEHRAAKARQLVDDLLTKAFVVARLERFGDQGVQAYHLEQGANRAWREYRDAHDAMVERLTRSLTP